MSMIKATSLLVAFTFAPTVGCGEDAITVGVAARNESAGHRAHASMDRTSASSMIWNIGPGDRRLKDPGAVPAAVPADPSLKNSLNEFTTFDPHYSSLDTMSSLLQSFPR